MDGSENEADQWNYHQVNIQQAKKCLAAVFLHVEQSHSYQKQKYSISKDNFTLKNIV
jgi:hypothetical protein